MEHALDFDQHNAEVKEVWERYHARDPIRVPMVLGVNPRIWVLDRALNKTGVTFESYFSDPRVMFETQLASAHYVRHNLPHDAEMGLPASWSVYVDYQNCYEALWFGGEIRFIEGNVPDVPPFLTEERKRAFLDAGPPDPFSGWLGRAWDYLDDLRDIAEGYEFHGRPVSADGVPGCGTDGPFTIACALRGPTEFCTDLYADPEFFHALMDFITEATITRIEAYRKRLGQPVESEAWGFADDSVQLLSVETYTEHVLPYHKRLMDHFGAKGPNFIHLCGNATHLFPTIRDALNVQFFDTGFPVDHGALRKALGPEVEIYGGPRVELLRSGGESAVRAEVKRILGSGVMEGGRFVLREGNNVAPGTPPANIAAMYEACKEFGRYGA